MDILVYDNNIERAIGRLKRSCDIDGLYRAIQRHSFFESRSQRRKRKDREAMVRLVKRRFRSENRQEAASRRDRAGQPRDRLGHQTGSSV